MKKEILIRDAGSHLSRRAFLKRSSLATLTGFMAADEAEAAARRMGPRRQQDAITCALIGYGEWGRDIADILATLPEIDLVAIVDTYDVMLTRAKRSFPEINTHLDYREVLDDAAIQSVIIATPTHTHRQIAIDALEAGKHVYCEVPLAASVEDARAIADAAAKVADTQIFQTGLLFRSNPQYRSIFQFIRSGATGAPVMVRAQNHRKESWRRASPNAERQRAQNWRLDPELSAGLIGELGINQFDAAFWFLDQRPRAITGFGQIMQWNDGRTLPDTVQAILAYPNNVHMIYDATLASSFDAAYDIFHGASSTIMVRDVKAWMFKEVDAPLLGWEVYARKDDFYKEQGINLAANATKLDAQELKPTDPDPSLEPPLWYAFKEFADNHVYGPFPPAAGYLEGYNATVAALKAHEATLNNTRVELGDDLFMTS